MVGLWHFDEQTGSVATDSGPYENRGTILGAVSAAGKFGPALDFDGVDDYVAVPEFGDNSLDLGDAFTWEAWIYPTVIAGENIIFNKEDSYEWAVRGGYLQWAINTGNWEWRDTGVEIPAHRWSHVVLTYDGIRVSAYLNGESRGYLVDDDGGGLIANDNDLRIGARGTASPSSPFSGRIDEVRILNRVLTSDEITAFYRSGRPHYDTLWESGTEGTAMTAVPNGSRSEDIAYAGEQIHIDGSSYRWRIKFWDDAGNEGEWSDPAEFTLLDSRPLAPTSLETEGLADPVSVTEITPEFSAVFNDPQAGDNAGKYRIEVKAVDPELKALWHFDSPVEGAENVVTNTDLSDASWSKGYCGDIEYSYDGPAGPDVIVAGFTDIDSDGSAYWYCYGDYAPQADGTTYTISLWVKTEDTISISAYTGNNSESGRKWTEYREVTPADGWTRVVWDSIVTDSPNDCDSLSFHWTGQAAGERLWISAPQMEAKKHATPFVVGSRSTTVTDSSIYGNDGSGSGVERVAGRFGNALSFDGSGGGIDCGSPTSLDDLSLRSVSFWTKLDAYHSAGSVWSHWLNKGDVWFVATDEDNSRYIFGQNFSSGNGRWSIPLSAIGLGKWHQVTIVYDSSSSANDPVWYVDGVEQPLTEYFTPSGEAVSDAAYSLYIGDSVNYDRWVDGIIDEVQIFNRALTFGEVEASYLSQTEYDYETVWDSGAEGSVMPLTGEGERSSEIPYAGTPIHTDGSMYQWRIKFWDQAGNEGAWSEPGLFTMVYSLPTEPTDLLCEGGAAPAGVLDLTPKFSAVFNDPEAGDTAYYYGIQVSRDEVFSDLAWGGGEEWLEMAGVTAGDRSSELSYAGDRLYTDGSRYWWRIRFRDRTGNESSWSVGADFTMFDSVPTAPTELEAEGEPAPGAVDTVEPSLCAVFNDPEAGDTATAYRVVVYAEGEPGSPVWESGWTGMDPLTAGESLCLDYPGDGVVFDGTTYYWRIQFEDATGNEGEWSEPGEFTMADYDTPPSAPDTLRVNGSVNPFYETYQAPVFTAVYRDGDAADLAEKYRIQVSRRPDFTTVAWDSGEGGEEMERVAAGEACGGIACGTFLDPEGVYYWRIKFWDIQGYEGEWSTEEATFGYDLGQTSSASFTLECWGMNGGGTANYPEGKRQSGTGYYYLVDSIGPEAVSLGTEGAPHLASASFHGYSHVLLAGLDTTGPSVPGPPQTAEAETLNRRPAWSWAESTDNEYGAGLRPDYSYLIFRSRQEGGYDNREWAAGGSYTPDEDLDYGGWYFTVLAVDGEGNESDASGSGYVNILATTPTPTPTPSVTPSATPTPSVTPSATPSATPTAVPTATPDGGCKIDLKLYLHGYLNETTLVQRETVVNVEFRTAMDQAGEYDFDLELDTSGSTGERELWYLPADSYYLLIRQKLSGWTFDSAPVPLGSNHLPVLTGQPREFIEGVATGVDLSDTEAVDYIGVYVSEHEQASSPMIAAGTTGRYWMLGGGDADGNELINVADILKWDTLVGFPDADDRGDGRFSEQGNFDGNDKIDGYDFNVWKRMVNEGVTYAPVP